MCRRTDVTSLDAFLAATDLDDLLRLRQRVSALKPDESSRIVSVIHDWSDRQAVANLLFHPRVMPDAVRFDAIDRALCSSDDPYLVLAATVGLQSVPPEGVPAEKRAAWVDRLLSLVQSTSTTVAGRASVTLSEWMHSVDGADILPRLVALYPVPDRSASRNVVAAVLDACGDLRDDEFEKRLLEWRVSDAGASDFRYARAEYADTKSHNAVRAMTMTGPSLAYIPNLSEGGAEADDVRGRDAGRPPAGKPWWRLW
jgi:hypothetical protein